ncbi:fanconi-associated nuclease 1 isoform X1 [Nasonia vitripennis]|uniref:Fanconi-associated nuclease n=1 Tax=Nasonia vitripennis TaxID=7425 RepID=A0A7M7Q1F7_NASVI|nr:fanconi-associated nuclease 1 isoform X1 [Nasonia vitripennis]XP_031779323.1 fanconi-associated nuclease 1 isoform X1 [Nasonia vitripennis]
MSQSNLQQTRIDQFYKVVSNKNTGCGVKLSPELLKQKYNSSRKSLSLLRKKRNSTKMSNFVESEIQILEQKTSKCSQNLKRTSSSELENSPKKVKSSVADSSPQNTNNQTPLKLRSPNQITSPGKVSNFTPKKSPQKNRNSSSPNKSSPRKLFFADRINVENVQQAIENLNLLRQGSIVPNEFDLNSVYQCVQFSIVYSDAIIPNAHKFELKDIIFPQEKHADHLLMVVMDVFSNPINCGYFTREELDLIFSLFTLSPESQMLFVRLLKRKLSWHRTSSIKYPEVSSDLDPFFKELVQSGFCTSDLESTDTPVLLNMLQVDEVRSICQKLKIDHRGNKPLLMERLLKYGNSSKSFFIGAKSPKSVLRSKALIILQPCVCLPEKIINLFDRIFTLLYPVQDPSESIADLFLTLTSVHKGEILFPPIEKQESFPIFQNRAHLISFVESKNALKEILALIEKKDWEAVRDLGQFALRQLSKVDKRDCESSLPLHIRKFIPEYTWVKVLSISVDAFKKTPETIQEAVNILETLIAEKSFTQSSRGRWYSELALIEMHHRKDLERSAELTLHALQQVTLTEVDVSGLLERLRKLMRRKTGISNETKSKIQKVQEELENQGIVIQTTRSTTIFATMASRAEAGGKSTWSVTINGNDKYYGSVEMLALQHYTAEKSYHVGLHCEGSLPVTLFAVFFWDELYKTFVPGAFVSKYQDAPLDLFTAEFFNNRKKFIEEKIKFIRALDLDTFTDWMQDRFLNYNQYRSVMSNTLFKNDQHFKEIVTCLGIDGVTGICERLVSNFRLWRSGFPDLILWNSLTAKCKIVEVKGPGDTLSEKQKLWLQYLERLGIDVEVCHVEGMYLDVFYI